MSQVWVPGVYEVYYLADGASNLFVPFVMQLSTSRWAGVLMCKLSKVLVSKGLDMRAEMLTYISGGVQSTIIN
jgi:hypothetical protein